MLAAAGITIGGLMAWPGRPAFAATDDDETFAAMRTTWNDFVTGGDFDPSDPSLARAVAALDERVQPYVAGIDRSPGRIRVFTDLPLTEEDSGGDSRSMKDTIVWLQYMAIAYRTPGSRFEGDAGVLSDMVAGLETWNRLVYNENQPEFDTRWWQWEIGATRPLATTCSLLYEHIPTEARERYLAAIDHFVPDPRYNYPPDSPRRTISDGANRVDLCQAVMVRGVVGDNAERVTTARDALAEAFVYATHGSGIYRDGSFIQHKWIAYNGGYGLVFLGGNVRLLNLLAGSPWDLVGAEKEFLFDVVDSGYIPMLIDGQMPSFVRGRTITRWERSEHSGGHGVEGNVLLLSRAADPTTAARWRAIVKGWLQRDTWDDPLEGADVAKTAVVTQLLADDSVQPAAEPTGHTMFPNMARAIHRGRGWALAIAMSNTRIASYETLNGENRKGWHMGAGAAYLYNYSDGGQYSDSYWPTVDPYRIVGTTVDTQELPHRPGGSYARPERTSHTGGAVLDGKFAAVGMDLEGIVDRRDSAPVILPPVQAKKSWFCFDDYVVALGAGIIGSSGNHVETIVENRSLHTDGDNALIIDGTEQPTIQGWSDHFDNINWAHLEGVGGYVFVDGGAVNALREERTGSWADVTTNNNPPTDPITRRYLTLWFDHGVDPTDETYAYLLAPGATPARTAELADDPGNVQILANDARVQAVRVPRLGVTAVNFFDTASVAGISVGEPDSPYLPTIIVDDDDHGFETVSGSWARSEGFLRYLGNQRFTGPGDGSAVARFRLEVPTSGRYSVQAWWFAFDNRATNTPFVIKHADGETTVRVNQRDDGSAWNELGTFDFTSGGDHYIEVTNDADDGYVIADAVRLAPVGAAPCSIVMQERASELEVAVADPTHEATSFTVNLERAGYRSWTADDTITVHQLRPHIRFSVNARGAAGASHTVTFGRHVRHLDE
jgi:hyaluronate lyase